MQKTVLRAVGILAVLLVLAVGANLVAHPVPPMGVLPVAAQVQSVPGGQPVVVPAAAPMPACANAGPAIARPAGLPAGFPLPPGTVLTAAQAQAPGLVVTGMVPATAHATAVYFNSALPQAGFRQAFGESEANEAESNYAGRGFQGRWKIRDLAGCTGAATLTLLVIQ